MKKSGCVRIIAGEWRSRLLRFPNRPGLRPTPDGVRETLFNWLQTRIAGAHCLDLFAGSGALGFEAASRRAARVDMVEVDATAFGALQKNAALLQCNDTVTLHCADAEEFLARCDGQYDLVFLDPPFDFTRLNRICLQLQRRDLLRPNARVYIESGDAAPKLPPTWRILRQAARGQVRAHLIAAELSGE